MIFAGCKMHLRYLQATNICCIFLLIQIVVAVDDISISQNNNNTEKLSTEEKLVGLKLEMKLALEEKNREMETITQDLQETKNMVQELLQYKQEHDETIKIIEEKMKNQEENEKSEKEQLDLAVKKLQKDVEMNDINIKYIDEEKDNMIKGLSPKIAVPKTCSEYKHFGIEKSGNYLIDPDGPGKGEPATKVYCDMKGEGVTIVNHDSMIEIAVDKCSPAGCFKKTIKYTMSDEQIQQLVKKSKMCWQTFDYKCLMAPLEENAWWINFAGSKEVYWDGEHEGVHICHCGIEQNCISQKKCNCDANVPDFSQDNGKLTNKTSLPVKELAFGGLEYDLQQANFTLGPLKCEGIETNPSIAATSCETLLELGHTAPGYYFLTQENSSHYDLNYCNMHEDQSGNNFQITTEGRLAKTYIAFNAYLTKPSKVNANIPFDLVIENIGRHDYDPSTGIFKVGISGLYFFELTIHPGNEKVVVGLYVLDHTGKTWQRGRIYSAYNDYTTMATSFINYLYTGDQVYAYLIEGSTYAYPNYPYCKLHGFLLYPGYPGYQNDPPTSSNITTV